MRWTRLLSRIWGTGTSTTCVRMRSDTRSRVITLTLSSVVLLGVLLRNLLHLLRDFLWDRRLCGCRLGPERFGLWCTPVPDLVAKLRRCFVDLRFQRTGSSTMQVFESCWRLPVACEDLGLPTDSRLCGAGVPWVLTGTHSVQSHPR